MDNVKTVGVNEESTREIEVAVERAEVTGVLGGWSHTVQLTSVQAETAIGPIMVPSSHSTASWPTSVAPRLSNHISNPHQGSTMMLPRSIPHPHDVHQLLPSLHPHPFTPCSPTRHASLSPPFRRFEDFRGRRLLRSQPGAPMVGEAHHSLSRLRQLDTPNEDLRLSPSRAAPAAESKDCMGLLMLNMCTPSPSKTDKLSPVMQDKQMQTEVLPSPDVSMVANEWCSSPSHAPPSGHSSYKNSKRVQHSFSPPFKPTMPVITEMESELKVPQRLTMEEGFEESPMARLIQEYTSARIEPQLGLTEMSITSLLSLEELTPDLIVDRGEDRNRRLPCYHLVKATMDNICSAVTAQQIFLQQAAVLIVERKSHFIVDPGNTLTPILQGTSSLLQLYAAWKALITRVKLGVKAWEKYIAEYQLQADVAVLSPLSTLSC